MTMQPLSSTPAPFVRAGRARVEPARTDQFPDIARLLRAFDNPRMSDADWERMLRTHGWSGPQDPFGYVLVADGRVVGFIGTIYSRRAIAGAEERFCNLACWIVEPAYRGQSLRLPLAALRDRDCTFTSFTPVEVTHRALTRSGFRVLESEVVLLPPVPMPWRGKRGARVETDRARIGAHLDGDARRVFDAHRGVAGAALLLLEAGGRRCLIAASRSNLGRLPVSHVHFASDPHLFWSELPRVRRALFRAHATLFAMVDARHAAQAPRLPFALRRRLKVPRLFRPVHPGLTPARVDALYSELMNLK